MTPEADVVIADASGVIAVVGTTVAGVVAPVSLAEVMAPPFAAPVTRGAAGVRGDLRSLTDPLTYRVSDLSFDHRSCHERP